LSLCFRYKGMKIKSVPLLQLLYPKLLLLIPLLAVSCNIFNPMGIRSPDDTDSDALILEGYLHYQDAEYDKAVEMFEKAIKADSTKSDAWLGLAKSTLYQSKINPFGLIPYFQINEGETPFIDAPDEFVNSYSEGISKALPFIKELIRRDTLTSLYYDYKRAKESEALSPALESFKEKYGNALEKFPLSDQRIVFANFSLGYGFLSMTDALLVFKKATQGISLDLFVNPETGELEFDLDALQVAALDDPELISKLNESFSHLSENLDFLATSILPSITEWSGDSSSFLGSDSLGNIDEIQQLLTEQIERLNATTFPSTEENSGGNE